jgi:hypothetical protein
MLDNPLIKPYGLYQRPDGALIAPFSCTGIEHAAKIDESGGQHTIDVVE